MKKLDCILRDWRYRVVEPYVPMGSDVLDIGGFDGSFLTRISGKIRKGVCIDPLIEEKKDGNIEHMKYGITDALPFSADTFDVVTLLAVYEHLSSCRESVTAEIYRVLKNDGVAALTVPHQLVDHILEVLKTLRVLDGMSTEEHEHFKCTDTGKIFLKAGFRLVLWKKFQCGLNNLFIFQKKDVAR